MRLVSPAFDDGAKIPKKYSEDGENVSPPLVLEEVPEAARSIAIIMDDPDAPRDDPWVHWVLYNAPADTRELPEALPRREDLDRPIRARQGMNTWPKHNIGYRGPAPPKGHGTHHYRFHAYALDDELPVSGGLVKDALLHAMDGHVVAKAVLVGTYER